MSKNVSARKSASKNRRTTFKRFSRAGLRLRNLERVIRERHGRVPDTDDVDVYLIQVAHCFRQIAVDRGSRVTVGALLKTFGFWCEDKAPRVCRQQVEQIACGVIAVGTLPADDECGRAIRLTYAERTRLRISAIGSMDVDRAMRTLLAKERRKERDRLRITKKRREKGVTPRAIWLASNNLSKTEPWKAMGICRRTWERRQKKVAAMTVASPSPHPSYNGRRTCDMAPAPAPILPHSPPIVPARAPQSAPRPGDVTDDDGGFAWAAPPPERSRRGSGSAILTTTRCPQ
jgi:hypothetical protein